MALTTGVYLDCHRHSAIVVRVRDGKVVYLTMNVTKREFLTEIKRFVYSVVSQQVDVVTATDEAFAKQFEIFLPGYPVMKAVKAYWRSGLKVTPEAKKIIRILAENAKAGRIPRG